MFGAVQISEEALSRMVPKYILTLSEVEFALGSAQRVRRLREIGALVGKREGKTLAFCAGHVARVSAEYFAGKFDDQLEALGA